MRPNNIYTIGKISSTNVFNWISWNQSGFESLKAPVMAYLFTSYYHYYLSKTCKYYDSTFVLLFKYRMLSRFGHFLHHITFPESLKWSVEKQAQVGITEMNNYNGMLRGYRIDEGWGKKAFIKNTVLFILHYTYILIITPIAVERGG